VAFIPPITKIGSDFSQIALTPNPDWDLRTSRSAIVSSALTIHNLSAAAAGSSVWTALHSVDLLGVLHEYACGGLGRGALSRRRFRHFATTAYE